MHKKCMALRIGLSFLTANHNLVLASVAAFILSEVLDLAVYVPLSRRNLPFAIFASGVVGTIVDSVVFVWKRPAKRATSGSSGNRAEAPVTRCFRTKALASGRRPSKSRP